MRIRRFNENSEETRQPKRVDQSEFFSKRNRPMDDFSTHERKTIREILERKNLKYDYSMSPEFVEIRTNWRDIEIVKYVDEWFTIIATSRYGGNDFYICDGFEEVEYFLNNINSL
jgi:hypothetical protein